MIKTTSAFHIAATTFFLIFIVGCSSERKNLGIDDPMTSKELTKEALSLSWDLLEKGQAMANVGKSISEILKIMPDSTLVQTNEESLLFFLQGSVPMVIELPINSDRPLMKGGNSRQVYVSSGLFSSLAYTKTLPTLDEDEEVNVVAHEKGEDQRGDKKALVLMPYSWQFEEDDDGYAAIKYLEENKNYENGTEVFKEITSLEIYSNFGEYDLVHLSTHGTRYCDPELFANGQEIEITYAGDSEYCRTLINSGVYHGFENKEDMYLFFTDPNNIDYVGNVIPGKNVFYLKNTFFSEVYSDGPENKIWVFSGCKLGQRSDFVNSINETLVNGHLFYWLNSVYAEDSRPAFEKFYENLINEGLDAQKAFEEIPYDLRAGLDSYVKVNNNSSSGPDGEIELFDPAITPLQDSLNLTTSLLHLQTGQARHGIEVIEMIHPHEEEQRIRSGDFYPLVGDFGDGEDEALTLKVELKGYTRAEFEERQMTLSLKVDTETVLDRRLFLPDVDDDEIEINDLDDQEYGVEVTVADIPIPDVEDKERITLKAYLHFDEERYSVHKEEVVIKADGIKLIAQGNGNRLIMTYDDKRRSLRIQTSGNQKTMFMDDAGYIYNNAGSQGWVKVNLKGVLGMMSMVPLPGQFGDIPVQGLLSDTDKNFFFPIVEWGIRFRMSAFERNPNFEKQVEDCGKPAPCYRFTGVSGQEAGVSALFDPNGRLKELRYQGSTIKYEYGLYEVIIPEAREMDIGI